jgi:hypothetical protein
LTRKSCTSRYPVTAFSGAADFTFAAAADTASRALPPMGTDRIFDSAFATTCLTLAAGPSSSVKLFGSWFV